MNNRPRTAESSRAELVESLLERQTKVLSDLDILFDQIDSAITELTDQRERESAQIFCGFTASDTHDDEGCSDAQDKRAA